MIVDYKVEGGKPIIYIFDRGKNRKRVVKKVKDFQPYFYVREGEVIKNPNIVRYEQTKIVGNFGEKMVKVVCKLPANVPELRERFTQTWEADILFPTRYTIDRVDKLERKKLRVLYIDLEMDDRVFPSIYLPENEILTIGGYDNFTNNFFIFVWRSDFKKSKLVKKFDWYGKEYEVNVFKFGNEREMLNYFLDLYTQIDCDIITGWNVETFDMMYLIERLKKLNVRYDLLSPMKEVIVDKHYKNVVIKGKVVLDMLKAFSHLYPKTLGSYKLEEVGKEVLGKGKRKISSTYKMWEDNYSELLNYNFGDVILLKEIDEKVNVIDRFDTIRRFSKSRFADYYSETFLVDNMLMDFWKGRVCFPTKTPKAREYFEGAKVFEPKRGLHENVIVFDLKSLYPSIITGMDLSPELMEHYSRWKESDLSMEDYIRKNMKVL